MSLSSLLLSFVSIIKMQKRKRQEKIDIFFKRNHVSEVESWKMKNVDIKQQ